LLRFVIPVPATRLRGHKLRGHKLHRNLEIWKMSFLRKQESRSIWIRVFHISGFLLPQEWHFVKQVLIFTT